MELLISVPDSRFKDHYSLLIYLLIYAIFCLLINGQSSAQELFFAKKVFVQGVFLPLRLSRQGVYFGHRPPFLKNAKRQFRRS